MRASGRLISIDLLRGLAALAVVAIHVPHHNPGGWREDPVFFPSFLADFGYLGVALFVMVSGFCIHRPQALVQARSLEWRSFWLRRFWRLYPPYAAAAIVSIAIALHLDPGAWRSQEAFALDVLTHAGLVHNLTDAYSAGLGNGAFWSLGTEEQLYLLYVPLFWMSLRAPGLAVAVSLLATVLWRAASSIAPPQLGVGAVVLGSWHAWPLAFWLHWSLGAYAVEMHSRGRALPRWCSGWRCVGLLGVGLLLNHNTLDLLSRTRLGPALAFSDVTAALLHNAGEILICFGFLGVMGDVLSREERLRTGRLCPKVAAVGRMSYSLYLVHVPIILLLSRHVPFEFTTAGWFGRYLVYGGAALAGGALFYAGVERWFVRARRRPMPETQTFSPPDVRIGVAG
jgi:peptidoglycan/LPS O-acetylase OafA/YrhL